MRERWGESKTEREKKKVDNKAREEFHKIKRRNGVNQNSPRKCGSVRCGTTRSALERIELKKREREMREETISKQ